MKIELIGDKLEIHELTKEDEREIKKDIKKRLMLLKLSGDSGIDAETYLALTENKRLLEIINRHKKWNRKNGSINGNINGNINGKHKKKNI